MKQGLRAFSAATALAMLLTAVMPLTAFADGENSAATSSETTAETSSASETDVDADLVISPAPGNETTEGETSTEEGSGEETSDPAGQTVLAADEYGRDNNYVNHLKRYNKESFPDYETTIPAASYIKDEGADVEILPSYEGKENVVKWEKESGKLTWQVEIPQGKGGLYNVALSYYPFTDSLTTIAYEMRIDGKIQFNSMKNFEFNRIFVNSTNDFEKDNRGNELRPEQVQVGMWLENIFRDSEGIYNEGFYFYFSEGVHTISLECVGESAILDSIRIYQKEVAPSYEELMKNVSESEINASTVETLGKPIEIEAEKTSYKSHSMLTPASDRTDALTQPSDPSKIRMNIVGGDSWASPGQWIQWDFEIQNAGYYKIGVRYKQNYLRGMFVTRTIRIDGEVPFEEMQNARFEYTRNWGFKTLSDEQTGETFYFYLEPGKHTITMEVTLGEMAELLAEIDECVYQLNYLYRKIIMITSTSPDSYRQYYLERKINDLIPRLTTVSNSLKHVEAEIIKTTGKGSEAATLEQAYLLVDSFITETYKLPRRLAEYKNNITTLASWVLSMKSQPLAIDYMIVTPANSEFKRTQSNFFEGVVHEVQAFIASFTEDYTSVGNVAEGEDVKTITVWTSAGRDNANILKQMIDDMFTSQSGIYVNLNLVQGSLIQAIAAGRNPDVTNSDRGTPMNLAIRGTLVNLKQFDDFDEIVNSRFTPGATTAYTLGDAVYALPETQTFNMMFYRTDILEELGMEVPQTWTDVYRMLPILQRNNLEVGMAGIYGTLLYQHGGSYYNEDLSATALTSKTAIDVFTEYTDLFTQYKLSVSYDFFNRFRSGEMPIGFSAYTFYTQLQQAAPEITGLWEMDILPGTEREDGTIDRSEAAGGTSIIAIKSDNADRESWAWEYIKWRTGAEAQARYGRELEALLGPTARVATANLEAFENLGWPKKTRDVINEQRSHLVEVEEVPGGYYLTRNFNNAFQAVVSSGEEPRSALLEWTKQTDSEIARKREEFGLQ